MTTQKPTIIIPLGLLQDLDHSKTIGAFTKLAQVRGKLKEGETLNLREVMPQIMYADEDVKAGKLDEKQFRAKILGILGITATDKEFDNAWNAMQGDLKKLSNQLQEIKKNKDFDFVIVSKTNPIHIGNVQSELKLDEEKTSNPLLLFGIPLYVSYQSPGYKLSDSALYQEIVANQQLGGKQTIIVLQCASNSPLPEIKKRDEERAKEAKTWAESLGIPIIDRKPKEDITDIILTSQRHLAVPMTEFGLKWHSGKVQLWSFNNKNNQQQEPQTSPNMYRY